MSEITNADMAKCARREVGMRRRVYPNWVASGRLKQEEADRQIAVMTAIAEHFEALVKAERPTLL